jgi:RHS repeat-associated protein
MVTLQLATNEPARYYRVGTLTHTNSDGDCLLDFEELTIYHTNPLLTDTDGDGLNDCDEALLYHTDPNHISPTGRGAISGKVVLDEDNDPATTNHPGLAGWKVYLDLDYDGQPGINEPSATSAADGSYLISQLDPGRYRVRVERRPVWVQVFPALSPPSTPDGYPDRIVGLFDSGQGPIPFPFGRYADPLPGLRLVFPIPPVIQVDPAIVLLGALPAPPVAGPYGGWWHVDVVAIPENSWITVAFDGEEIVDGPGPDLIVVSAQGGGVTHGELYLGSTEANLTSAGVIAQEEVVAIDLATLDAPKPVRYVKLRSLDSLGAYPGWDLVGFEALNFRPLDRAAYDVDVLGGQTVSNINFGVTGEDRPPKLFISTDRTDVRAGESLTAQVTASDDLGVATVTLKANGVPVSLDSQLKGTISITSGGLLTLEGTATDTINQQSTNLFTLITRNADGTLPDLSGLGATSGSASGAPTVQIQSPVAGEILSTPRSIIGTISGILSAVATWQVEYALADLVNPEALDASDPDYVLLSQGTGPVTSASLGTLPGDTLPAGAYFIRVMATAANSTTAYLGFVVGVRIDPLDIRPEIVITKPTNETRITFTTNIIGNITTRQQLREWYVEYAALSQVNLANLGDNSASWKRIASGTNAVTNAVLARFDATLVPNDSYVIRVSAWNKNGLGWTEPVTVHVTGNAKLGNFAVEFTDVQLPLAGIPITIKRRYDSLNAERLGDFGHGWSLALQDADIAETIPQTGTGFGSTPFKVGTRVYLSAPDGQRIGFTFQPEVGSISFIGAAYKVVFKPDPGIRYTLAVPEGDSSFLSLNSSGEAAFFFIPLPYNPDTYVLTDTQGTSYTYDQADGLIEIKDANGNRVTFSDTTIEHSSGRRVQLTRDTQHRITRITAPDGQIWNYQYNTNADLAQVTYPGNLIGTFSYATNRAHFLETIDDPSHGATQRTEYGSDGRVTAIVDANGNRIQQTLDPGAFTGTYSDARGNVTQYAYDALGNLTRSQDPLGGVTTWEFKNTNFPALVTATVDPRGNRTTYSYDARGNLLQEVHPLKRATTYTYDDHDRVLTKYYNLGGKDIYEYDAQGNLIHFESPLGKWDMTYTTSGLLASVLDGEGGLTRFDYDGANSSPSRITMPDGSTKRLVYDAFGRVLQQTDPINAVTRFEYDTTGRLVRQTDPAGGVTSISYDTLHPSLPSAITNRTSRVTQFVYDALQRLIQISQTGGATTRFEYDADGNRTAVVDSLTNRYEFKYDAMSRLLEESDPLGKKRTYSYDLAGNRTNSVDRNLRQRSFVYDALNRVAQEKWHDPNGGVLRTLTLSYDFLDRVTSASDPDATVTRFWVTVPGNRLENEHAVYPGRTDFSTFYAYDNAGRRQKMTSGMGSLNALKLAYEHDLSGYLRILTSHAPLPPSTVTNAAWQVQLWRNARGDLTELRRFSDSSGRDQVSQTFFSRNTTCSCQIDSITHIIRTNQPMPEAAMTFTRDLDGTITTLTEGTNNFGFIYDPAMQLSAAIRNGVVAESYAYDINGNRIASHLHAGYVTGPANRLIQAGPWMLSHDDEGNLVTKSNVVSGDWFMLVWDYRGRLTQVIKTNAATPASSVVTDYRYDPFDRRIAVIRNSITNWTYYDRDQPIADYVGTETTPIRLFASGESLDDLYAVWNRGQTNFWILTDQLGSVRRVLARDGTEVAALAFDSYGNSISITGAEPAAAGRFAFAGREWDADTGLYYNRARYYDPELGRFVSEDPLGFSANDENLYRYGLNNPRTLVDPLGTDSALEYRIFAGLSGCAAGVLIEISCGVLNQLSGGSSPPSLRSQGIACLAGAVGGAAGAIPSGPVGPSVTEAILSASLKKAFGPAAGVGCVAKIVIPK